MTYTIIEKEVFGSTLFIKAIFSFEEENNQQITDRFPVSIVGFAGLTAEQRQEFFDTSISNRGAMLLQQIRDNVALNELLNS